MVATADFASVPSCRPLIKKFNFGRRSSKINGQIHSLHHQEMIHNHFLFLSTVMEEDEF